MMRQRGLVLLPVTLALAIVGTLAYAMTRDGTMSVSAVDAQYDIDSARYLAEAGVALLKYRNEQAGCGSAQGFVSPVTSLEGGVIASSGVSYKKPRLGMTVTATTARGTINQVVIDEKTGVLLHDIARKVEITVSAQNGSDTFIRAGGMVVDLGLKYLETSAGSAHGLVKFGLASVPPDAAIVEATLRLYLESVQSTQAGSLAIHRMLRAWPFLGMSWENGWTNQGGDFAPQASGTINAMLAPGWYTTRIDDLVQAWTSQPPTNLGLAMKPAGLVTARFSSFEASSNQPQLFLRYYPPCK